jgi:cyclophilin family peptidyl-prolyl cis-trans isomerase
MDFAIGSQPEKQIFIELLDLPFPDGAPKTVENFLRYIEYTDPDTNEVIRRYDNTFIHRSISGFIIQGGGFAYTPDPAGEDFARDMSEVVIDKTAGGQDKIVQNEFDVSRSNVRGTVAMAKVGGDPDSATSQWFINIGDNAGNLDNQNGGFTVFGRVIGMTASNGGTTVADEIAELETVDKSDVHSAFTNLPLFGFTQGDPVPDVTSANLVRLTSVTVVEPVQPSVLDMGLTLINSTSPTQTVTLQNLTDAPFTISEFTPDLLASPFSLSSETCSATTLLPLQTCTLFIDFTPTEAGQKNASFSIATDSPTLSSLPVSVTGTGAPQEPTITFSPALGPALQFGNLGPGQDDRTLDLTISNLGIDALTVDARSFTGTGTENLALSNDCSSLATGDSCTVSITFSLLLAAIETAAQIEILSNDPQAPSSIIQITGSTSSDNDGVADAIEAAVSSSGDGNLDGIADVCVAG